MTKTPFSKRKQRATSPLPPLPFSFSHLFGQPKEAPSHRHTATEHGGRRQATVGFLNPVSKRVQWPCPFDPKRIENRDPHPPRSDPTPEVGPPTMKSPVSEERGRAVVGVGARGRSGG
ncbi:hypothetical protein ES332_A01G046600v1 [Gossypium tomentosum]|uniref:Uncharacterized protein n=1 Tax=Gossypium tomentosum TaxID=34277 RepID=A0A5D2RLL7_GOSTO|nr:hypothetical protein ES332_A01G046600v1 [Gossypium tomentosum]TYI41745.1 hypothetical protein ES332_A01G046600v1 [Gossypium tomentosum]TYI41747.1 hypothetical protein ES332_A01G046600v1 [Gossypium tomentosum]TYI41748.1 hypothetical protein ES332_A01G046600v1 [Gossypium tomentosum]TYI41749.1 hypothetical protein ES332_A01G046600v1 [Gossypium tomentosum]